MKQLLGVWQGTGTATFPTIETTSYREHLIFEAHADDLIFKVEQKTWRIHPNKNESLLYWECGFLRQLTDTTCEWVNAQNNGRTEVLKGQITQNRTNQLSISLTSISFSNDVRMTASSRTINVIDNTLSYTMQMATQSQPTLQEHLAAQLKRG